MAMWLAAGAGREHQQEQIVGRHGLGRHRRDVVGCVRRELVPPVITPLRPLVGRCQVAQHHHVAHAGAVRQRFLGDGLGADRLAVAQRAVEVINALARPSLRRSATASAPKPENIGSTMAPIFATASIAAAACGRFGRYMPTTSPRPIPRRRSPQARRQVSRSRRRSMWSPLRLRLPIPARARRSAASRGDGRCS